MVVRSITSQDSPLEGAEAIPPELLERTSWTLQPGRAMMDL
jgi:hypothetical protein